MLSYNKLIIYSDNTSPYYINIFYAVQYINIYYSTVVGHSVKELGTVPVSGVSC